jgi:type II restriction/modification system DNA methylase subunit YeeA
METKHLKKYAPEARRDFIAAVKNKAAVYGLLPKEILPMQEEGDVVIIGERPFPRSVAKQRKELEARIRKEGFQQFIEAVAYTWFNRFVAIRYMELHGYLDHGYRVLSHPEGKSAPEILENAERVELPGLKRDEVVDLKLDGGKDEQLYQILLLAQCNALHKAMPFLFESIKDGTELLLPDNLLHTDSLVRTLVNDIPEDQWQNVEIIGWLYQFYIAEKKDEVMGKVVKSEDIPAATQLFTPNWIVKYLVQNSLGRKWVATYPDSPLKQQMEFYIEPAEQTPEVQKKLGEVTPESLNPEELTLLDPACGSGHVLVEAYDLFKAIYQERGYRARDIPKLIIENNLYGLEIDERAAQLAAFALLMKARADDRGIFGRVVEPQVLAVQNSVSSDAGLISESLNSMEDGKTLPPVYESDITQVIDLFQKGTTFGSLIQVPETLTRRIPVIAERTRLAISHGEMFDKGTATNFAPLVRLAQTLATQYDIVVTNPPYLGGKFLNTDIKTFAKEYHKHAKGDLFAMFIERCLHFTRLSGEVAMVTMQGWMFISSFDRLREHIVQKRTIQSLVQIGFNSFPELNSKFALACSFVISKARLPGFTSVFVDLNNAPKSSDKSDVLREQIRKRNRYCVDQHMFDSIPGSVLCYWIGEGVRRAFASGDRLAAIAEPKQGLATTDNNQFVRRWYEVDSSRIVVGMKSCTEALQSKGKWFPYNKGGSYRKWYGNNEFIVNWENDGYEIKQNIIRKYPYLNGNPDFVAKNTDFYFRKGVTWSFIGLEFGARLSDTGFIFDVAGSSAFCDEKTLPTMLGFMNSSVASAFLKAENPTLNYQAGNISTLPWLNGPLASVSKEMTQLVDECVQLSAQDTNSEECSPNFQTHPLCLLSSKELVRQSWDAWSAYCTQSIARLRELELRINSIIVECYDLEGEVSPNVSDDSISLRRAIEVEDISGLVSYAIGCMMGRYSLDDPGLIYARSGNEGFDSGKYKIFPADDDGIVPITDMPWFADDATMRVERFVKAVWPEEHLEENLKFIAESLDQTKGETSRECIRRYLATNFYKHHMSMYKKRPIYWLFSSGKQRAFQCLVYLHRYNAGTLSRMRTEYVVKLQGKINARIEQLESDIPSAGSTSHRKKLEKERDTLIKQREELQTFDEKLRHYADQRIELDLDDGVKVNYGKFGDLLAEVKAITGEKPKMEVAT